MGKEQGAGTASGWLRARDGAARNARGQGTPTQGCADRADQNRRQRRAGVLSVRRKVAGALACWLGGPDGIGTAC